MAAFLPTYLMVHLPPPPRLRNIIYLVFIVGWLLSAYAWVAWWVGQGRALPPLPAYVRVALLAWLPLALATDHNTHLSHAGIGQGYTTVVQAYYDWLSGDAARYDATQRTRYAILRATHMSSVGLPPLPVQPHLCCFIMTSPPTLPYGVIKPRRGFSAKKPFGCSPWEPNHSLAFNEQRYTANGSPRSACRLSSGHTL